MRRLILATAALLCATAAYGHCDSIDGPVVQAARRALASGDVNVALPWVKPAAEAEVRKAFDRAHALRTAPAEVRDLAQTWFFETVVRLHRSGEGAPYDGLKPAGADLGPAIPAADAALKSGSLEQLEQLLLPALRHELHRRFERAVQARNYKPSDVNAGREYVAAYVDFLHFAENLHSTAAQKHEH